LIRSGRSGYKRGMSLYELLLTLHIVGAILWIGCGFLLLTLNIRADRAGDDDALGLLSKSTEDLGPKLFIPASLGVLLTGIGMTIDGPWSLDYLWIVMGLAGYAATFVTGAFFLAPRGEAVGKAFREQGGFTPETRLEMRRILWLARIDYIVLFLTIVTMALKPTGDDVGLLAAMAVVLVGGAAYVLMRMRALDTSSASAMPAAT
jgi:hypothetical protein